MASQYRSSFLGACLFILSSVASASDEAFHNVTILMERMFAEYQMFKGEQGDPRYAEKLDITIDEYNTSLDTLEQLLAEAEMSDLLEPISPLLVGYRDLMVENKESIESGGYEEFALIDEMVQNKNEALGQLIQARKNYYSSKGIELGPQAEEARNIAVIMQRLAARYIEITSSEFGTSFRDQSEEKSIDELALSFSDRLKELSVQNSANPDVSSALSRVSAKWRFIEKSMINYQESTVPFLVSRYSSDIVDQLSQVASMLEGN